MSWYFEVLKKYAVFNGRSTRPEFWYFMLFNVIILLVLFFIDHAVGTERSGSGLLRGIYSLAVLLPAFGVEIRRMHDTNHSGWWILCPIVNIVFWAQDGTAVENKYGPNPKAIPEVA